MRAAFADPVVHRAVIEVAQLLRPHSLLHEPEIKQRIETVSDKAASPTKALVAQAGEI